MNATAVPAQAVPSALRAGVRTGPPRVAPLSASVLRGGQSWVGRGVMLRVRLWFARMRAQVERAARRSDDCRVDPVNDWLRGDSAWREDAGCARRPRGPRSTSPPPPA